jgi:hypothetical protein
VAGRDSRGDPRDKVQPATPRGPTTEKLVIIVVMIAVCDFCWRMDGSTTRPSLRGNAAEDCARVDAHSLLRKSMHELLGAAEQQAK